MTIEDLERCYEGSLVGSRLSQKKLYEAFFGYAISIIITYVPSHEDAQEICQDSFVKAFEKLATCQGHRTFKPWLRRIIVNKALDHLRAKKLIPIFNELENEVIPSHNLANNALDKLGIDEKMRMIMLLPDACRLTFNLYAIDGFTTAEIAEKFNVAEGTVRSNLAKARIRLQNMIICTENFKILK